MNEDVVQALNAWLPAFGLPSKPAEGTKDLAGRSVRVARMNDEAAVRFFFPRRSLIFQQRLVKALTRSLRQRGAKIATVLLAPEDYARWIDAGKEADTPELRYRFASVPPPEIRAEA